MKERIEIIIRELNLTKKEFAQSLGVSQSAIGDFLNGRLKSISTEVVASIYKIHNVNPIWILTGDGEMFINSPLAVEKSDEIKEVKHLKGINGNVETFPHITDVEQISRTKWFESLSREQKEIIAGICMIKSNDLLRKVSTIVINQVTKEEADEQLNKEFKELENELIRERRKIQKGEAG